MKNLLIYIAGIVTGIVLSILISFLCITNKENPIEEEPGITMFDEPGDSIDANLFKVFQVINSKIALAFCVNELLTPNVPDKNLQSLLNMLSQNLQNVQAVSQGTVVLLINDEGKLYYDDEIIKVPQGQQAKQMGIYQYSTESGYKTVPIVKIMK
ncbi:hypothetical protein [uncultured Alistipes sp.]|jgi:hypothetical protein|uniref:hypothetical protein n=1 Tax=uncultured Alistipes sp. TaxID=538949 RepID=UPI002593EC1F|nr:hypothetical protein [uncultured Alistipes sp.]